MSDYDSLKAQHRTLREGLPDALNLRVHRALSWLQRAEQCEDMDGRFVFLWIAFNATYAQEIPSAYRLSETASFNEFLQKVHELDTAKRLDALIWKEFSGPIRVLLDNPYVFEAFWRFHRGEISAAQWQEKFSHGKKKAALLLGRNDTPALLALVLQRIYTLRNQILHGGATWNGSVNRAQVQDCTRFMNKLVPTMITVMLGSPATIWGEACYPVVES